MTTSDRRYINRKQRELNTLRGIPNRVAATDARTHLALLRQTMGWAHIATATGCSACHLRAIASGESQIINRVTHNKILNTRAAATPERGFYVDATGARRRVHALMARAHSQDAIAEAAHTTQHRISVISLGAPRVRQMIADRIADAYEQLSGCDGNSKRALFLARKHQWLTTDYWADVDRIDDPAFDPDAKSLRIAQIAEDAAWLLGLGLDRNHVAARLGVTRDYMLKALRETERGQVAA